MDNPRSAFADQIEQLPAEVERLVAAKDPLPCYDLNFVGRMSTCDRDLYLKLTLRLKKIPDFSIKEFERRMKEEREQASPSIKLSSREENAWRALLRCNARGMPTPQLANAIYALKEAPEWKGVLAYNELSCRAVRLKKPPFSSPGCGPWTDQDDILTANWLQHNEINVGKTVAADAVQAVCGETKFHPIRHYLATLKWDGEARIGRWLTDYMGVEWSEYSGAVGAKWLISAVARVMNPGCQVDTCLVLEGEQGIRKSSALRLLAGDDWFTDQIADLDDKDSSQDLAGKWIIEFPELDKFSKHEQGVIKSFIPRRSDHYRQSYGRRTQDYPRQCVFAASTNQTAYLGDETGGRRWWPVRCGEIDIKRLTDDRNQLWAEAYAEYQEGRTWWLEDDAVLEIAREEQEARYDRDPWDEVIWEWVLTDEKKETEEELIRAKYKGRLPQAYSVSSDAILDICLKRAVGGWTKVDKDRVGRILKSHGMERFKKRLFDADNLAILDAEGKQRVQWRYRRSSKSKKT